MMTVDKGHSNTAFVGDDEVNNSKKPVQSRNIITNSYVLEVQEKKPGLETDYNPYEHRHVEHPTTNNETLIHLLKGSLGTGILAMPNAFHNAGWLVGAVGTLIIGILCTYCIHLLIKAEYELCRRKRVPSLNYPAVTKTALLEGPEALKPLSNVIIHIINTFLLIYQLGTCCVYVVFVASNIKAIADFYTESDTDVRLFMLIILLPLILINWVRNLKFLAPFSTLANFITLISFGIILYYIFREPVSFEGREAVGHISGFPLFFGTVLFALEAIGVILPLENEMKTPKKFGGNFGVLNKAMVLIVTLYIGMGFFGYLNYGPDAKGSITLNLPEDEILAQCVKGMLAFAIYITHGLACYVAIDITWNDYMKKRFGESTRTTFYEYMVRTVLVLITFLLAVAIPNLELFISLFGALCLSALGIAFPALIQTCTYWHDRKGLEKVWMICKNSIIGIIAVVGLVVGTSTSLKEIILTFGEHDYHTKNQTRPIIIIIKMGSPKKDVNLDMQLLSKTSFPARNGDMIVDEDYDPHLHRNRPVPTTNFETLVHLLKGSLGTGILAMPQAFYNAGYISGFINTILIGILCTYCLHVLVQAQYVLCKRHRVPILTYPISMKMALEEGPQCLRWSSRYAIAIVDGFMIVYQLGICCVYIVFVASNIKQIVDLYYPMDVKIHCLILLIPLMGINMIRNLKLLAPFSTFANIITFVGIGIIMYYVLDDLPSLSEREMIADIGRFPLFFGTTLFAIEAVGVIIALENNMKTPKSFGGWCGVLNSGMVVIIALYAGVGFLGYQKYGADSEGSITLNLPQNEILSRSVRVLFAIAIFISYGLQCYVPVDIIWNTYLIEKFRDSNKKLVYEMLVRIVVVIITFLLAVAIPRLGLFISLFGALCLSALGIAFPAIMDICVRWPGKLGPGKLILWKDIILILLGIVGLVSGTYTSVRDIVYSFK
ncbi:uncharacterized protein LOC129773330 [Toxorhynchites rutilus septentrionalis]|uniref:uncharacterized protein LOC129773330 n=1 Tax=Toxorhynchites rutilus septentrionalis TaxID=329112 RepID=UPI00247AE44D|nr:uncharacterized protein LOC129773330 [Toxorhynchites rutilus septentrionalis]